jgi:DNA helicase II / ATP-dependent DNA helicase PcrA
LAADDLLHDLDDAQRRAVTSPAQPLAILAPAGSGKTRVLTRRIAWRVDTAGADASHVLALTFTRKAAAELRDRLRRLGLRDGVAAGTFHGVAWAQLRARWADEGRPPPTLLARKGRLLADGLRSGRDSVSVAQLAAEIEWAKARLVGPDGYVDAAARARRRPPGSAERIAEHYRQYEEQKRDARMVDFDDLLRLCSHLIETDAAFAAVQRWRFRHLFVDEFQDVNPLQLRLLDAWRGSSYDLCVVGDPHQAIYGWNGADAGFLEGFRRLYPPAEVVSLDGNYRSSPQVLTAAADVLRAADLGERPVRAVRPDGVPVRLERHPTDRDEARAIARAARDRRDPRGRWAAQAVLVRTHAQVPLITEAFRTSGIPYRVRGGDALLDRPEVREAVELLRHTSGSLAVALRDLAALADEARAEAAGLGGVDDSDGNGGAHAVARSRDMSAVAERAANLAMLEELAHDQLRLDPSASAGGFVAWLVATLQAEGADGATDAVTIATLHAAKGLEWPLVHLAGLEDGLVPIAHARTHAARAEEARLLYVAMTRAEDELRCSWAGRRTFGDKVVERRVTPWLLALADRQREQPAEPVGPAGDWRARLAEQRERLALVADSTRPRSTALAALHAWRHEAARAARVEPETLVGDHLLEAIAEAEPTTVDELVAVPGMGALLAARVGPDIISALDARATAGTTTP